MHGYWGGHYPGGWGWRPYGGGFGYGGYGWGLGTGLGIGLGSGLGWGLSSWLYGPSMYNWGYSNYYNPYYGGYGGGVGQGVAAYDYAQPINLQASVPDDATTTQANTTFDSARDAFKQGNYAQALDLTDQSLKQSPNDSTLHEFRALCLFAMGRYDESAASLFAVLSAGPGWDWTTLIRLYADPSVYTQQLRALEEYVNNNQQSAGSRFVLAYEYLTEGYPEQAVEQFKVVTALQPKDQISAQLIKQLQKLPDNGAPAADGSGGQTPPATEAVPATPVDAAAATAANRKTGKLDGAWTAQANGGTSISVAYENGNHFSWKVNQQGQDRTIAGNYSYVNGILTMVQDQASTMVGEVNFQDDGHFTFKVLGAGPDDPGLSFSRSQ